MLRINREWGNSMKHFRIPLVCAAACLVLLTGCDRLKVLLAKPQERKPSAAPVPSLQILGVSHEETKALSDLLHVRGLLQQADDYVVIINTQLVRKGEVLLMRVRNEKYDVRVQSISKMRVVLKADKRKTTAHTQGAKK